MTREEAIVFFERLKAEEEKTIENLKNGLGITSSAHQRFAEAFGMAIAALREQEERSKGCEFCCYTEFPDKKLYPKENDGFDFYAGAWKRVADDDFIEDETDHIKSCPMCGRRLGEV